MSIFDHLEQWQINRRTFLSGLLLSGVATQLSLFTSCSDELKEENHLLSNNQSKTLDEAINLFFPNDGNGPSANEINAFGYILWVLEDSLTRKTEENEFIIKGIDNLNQRAMDTHQLNFGELDETLQQELMETHMKNDDDRKWCSVVITFILEALLLDPIYGGNKDEVGWKWLNHTAGFPRPNENNRYEVIMKKQLKQIS